jgi:serine protease
MKIQDWRVVLTRCLLLAAAAISLGEAHAAPAAALAVLQPSARVIVKLKPWSALLAHPVDAAASQAHPMAALGGRMGLALGEGRHLGERTQVVTAMGLSSAALARRLAGQSDVEYAVVDHWMRAAATPNDPDFSSGPPLDTVNYTGGPTFGQWYLQAPDNSTVYSSINATGAWDITKGASDQLVAVLDTGIRPEHPDLAGKLAVGYDMISDVTTAADGSGRDNDPSDPGDWDTSCSNPQFDQTYSTWHGTQVAGIIGAATNNGVGMAGVGWNVKVLPVRVLGKCGGYESDIEAGMMWAAGLSVLGYRPTQIRPRSSA